MTIDTEISTIHELQLENEDLRERLDMAEETLQAIRRGEVDSLVIRTPDGFRVFTLTDAHTPYRLFIDEMQQGAATLGPEGTVLYCNRSLPALLGVPIERVIGARWHTLVAGDGAASSRNCWRRPAAAAPMPTSRLRAGDGTLIPVSVTANPLSVDESGPPAWSSPT